MPGDAAQDVVETVNQAVGGGGVPQGDVIPNFVVITPRITGAENARHGVLRRSCLGGETLAPVGFDILRGEFNKFPPVRLGDADPHFPSQTLQPGAADGPARFQFGERLATTSLSEK